MRKTGLIVLIVICLIVFVASLTGGVLLTLYSIGWQDLLDQTRLQDRTQQVMDRITVVPWLTAGRESFTIDEKRSLDLSGIRSIEIKTISSSITVRSTSGATEASLTGTYMAAAPLQFIVAVQDNTLKIQIEYPRHGVFSSNLKLHVVIPDTYDGAIVINSVSGAVRLPDTHPTERSQLDIGTVSGRIHVEQAAYSDLKVSSVSGEIVLLQITGRLDCKATSGAVQLDYATFRDTTVRTVSGSVSIALPEQTDAEISFATVSGRFNNQGLPLTIDSQTSRKFSGRIGNGEQKLDITTTSGSVRLQLR